MKQRGRAHRSKTGKFSGCVRFNDLNGLEHKFNKTGFRTDEEIGLFYDFIKRYEQELRAEGGGTGAGAGAGRKERLNYPSVAQSTSLKLLPEGFRDFTNKKKVDSLKELCEALVSENAPRIVEQDEVVQDVQDVGLQVYPAGKMEVDEGCAADLGPVWKGISDESRFLGGHPLQDAGWNQQDYPQGRPPTNYDEHADSFFRCMTQIKHRACGHLDILLEIEALEEQFMCVFNKLKDRERSSFDEDLQVEPRNTHLRSRQMEIHAQLVEDISSQIQLDKLPLMEGIGSQASNSGGDDMEHGVTSNVNTMPHVPAVYCPLSPFSSSGGLPDGGISEALKVAPINTGRLKENEKEIHPPVYGHYTDWNFPYSNPGMEGLTCYPQGIGLQVSHLQAWNKQLCAGDCSTTMLQYGGNSPSQFVSVEDQWNESDIEPDISLWSPDRY